MHGVKHESDIHGAAFEDFFQVRNASQVFVAPQILQGKAL